MHIIQLILLLFVAFAILKTVGRAVKRDVTRAQLVFWCLVWLAIAAAAIFPQWTVVLANRLGVGRGSDLVLYIAVALLLYIVFRLTVRIERMDRAITKVVRRDALSVILSEAKDPVDLRQRDSSAASHPQNDREK